MQVEPMDTSTIEEQWAAWEARCGVSHAPHFASRRNVRVPLYRLTKPLESLRVALATSGGAYVDGTDPFDLISHRGDTSVRWIPGDVATAALRFAHDHYDHTDPDEDPNCIFPIERLRELAAERIIGSVAGAHLGFMGWIPDPEEFALNTIPAAVARLAADRVDAVVLSPG